MTQQNPSLEEQYNLMRFSADSRQFTKMADSTPELQEVSLSLVTQRISEFAAALGCEVSITAADRQESVQEFDVNAFTCFAVTFLCSARDVSLTRSAKVSLLQENGYCIAQMSFDDTEQSSEVAAAVEAFTKFSARLKMRFDWRRDRNILTVTFTPVSKDWALLEVKSPVDDGDELIVVD